MGKYSKPIYKTVMFWQIILGLIVVLALGITFMVTLSDGGVVEAPTTAPVIVETTTEAPTTEATLPPPPENPYGPLDFVYEGDYLTCTAGEAELGVDVSTWQGQIDWQQVKDAGMEFAMIRVGYRGLQEGTLDEDDWAQANYEGASAAGLKVGAYFFSQAITVEEAREEAGFVLDLIKDWDVQMPIVYDWEYVSDTARTANMDARTLTDCTIAFCEVIQDAGFDTMIYFNIDQSHKKMFLEELVDYGFWLALYDSPMSYAYKIDMWQYTDEGSVPGIDGPVDLNLYLKY